jgi:hypothetical protein
VDSDLPRIPSSTRETVKEAGWVIELHQPYGLADLPAALKKAGADFQIVSQVDRKSCPVVMLRRTKSLH